MEPFSTRVFCKRLYSNTCYNSLRLVTLCSIVERERESPAVNVDAHCCHMDTAMKHPVSDRVKPSFVILDIQTLFVAEPWASECPDVKNYKWQLYPVWHRMYPCSNSGWQRVNLNQLCVVMEGVCLMFGRQHFHCLAVLSQSSMRDTTHP